MKSNVQTSELVAIVEGDLPLPLPEELTACHLPEQGMSAILAAPPAMAEAVSRDEFRRSLLEVAALRQARLEALAAFGTVLPIAPGTAVPPDLDSFVRANAPTLRDGIGRVRGRVQFQVVAGWHRARAAARFAASPELAALPQDAREAERDAALGRLAGRIGDAIALRLAGLACDAIRLPRGTEDLANLALLVEAKAVRELEATLEEIDSVWTEGLRLRLIGPAPAISFALARIEVAAPDAAAAAAEMLGLDPSGVPDTAALAAQRRSALRKAAAQGARPRFCPAASDAMDPSGAAGRGASAGRSHAAPGTPPYPRSGETPRPADIDRAVAILAACARLGRMPATAGPLPLVTLHRDGPPAPGTGQEPTRLEVA